MERPQRNNPLHGITLESIVTELAARVGWRVMADFVPIRCLMFDPTVTSSLRFLRKTPWARAKVEALFLELRERQGPPTKKEG